MNESKIIGSLLPSLDEFQEIQNRIRSKYNLPNIEPGNKLEDFIFTEIPYKDIYQDIYAELQNLLPLPTR